jgi:hypothetical protein
VGLCQPSRCGCGVVSDSLVVTGSGNPGDPYRLSGSGAVLAAESALPGSGIRTNGMLVSTTDTGRILRWNGTIGRWVIVSEPPQQWTPVVTQGVGITTTPNKRFYQRANGRIDLHMDVTCTTAGTASNVVVVGGLPFAFPASTDFYGTFLYFDTGNVNLTGIAQPASTSTFNLVMSEHNNLLGPDHNNSWGDAGGVADPTAIGFAIANGDAIRAWVVGWLSATDGSLPP